MRLLRTITLVLGGLAALALVALWQVPRFLDWDRYRTTIERVASAGLGRPVQIAGPIGLSLLPEAVLRAGNVTIADTGDGAGASVAELRMRVALQALLTGRVEAQDLVLHGARMRLPWPLAGFTLRGTPPPGGLHARVEDGTIMLGGLPITAISGELLAGGPDTALSASGLATVLGRPWRMTGRLGHPGSDGSATLAMSLDGQDAGVGTGGMLAGQVAADGSVSGRISGRGPDLSLLLPAPSQPWSADGQLVAGSGLLVADNLELAIGGIPARGAVALRLLPVLRLDAALATNRLDLDAWLPPLLRGGTVALPTGIDLSAEAAPFAGGTLRRLRAGFELTGHSVTLRETDVILPGDATLTLSGTFNDERFQGSARLEAPNVPQTLAWLRPRAPALLDALPLATLHTAKLAAGVQADGDGVAFAGLLGAVDGVPLQGNLALKGGARPAVAADLQLTGPALDHWLPAAPATLPQAQAQLAAAAKWAGAFDADVTIHAQHPVWQGTVLDQVALEGSARAGTLDLRQFAVTGPGLSVALSGSLDGALRVADGKLALQLDQADTIADRLPPPWQFTRALFRGPLRLEASATGPANAWSTLARLDLADARLQANGEWDLPGHRWTGSLQVRHPGAPRLVAALGMPGLIDWLGEGSFSLQTGLNAAADRVALTGLEMSAGGLRGTGDLVLGWPQTGPPALTGSLAVDTLPLPLPYLRSTNPIDFGRLHAVDASLRIVTPHLLWGGAAPGDPASARLTLSGGALRLQDVTAHLAGGALAGQFSVDAAEIPHLHAAATLTGATLDGPVFGTALDLAAGRLDGSLDLTTSGFSPSALLAALQGSMRLTVHNGALSGLDAGQVLTVLQSVPASAASDPDAATLRAGVVAALNHGATPFSKLDAAGTLASGLLTLTQATLAAPSGAITAAGDVDLPGGTMDLALALHPELDGAPALGLRLIGPASNPARNADIADLTRWLAAH